MTDTAESLEALYREVILDHSKHPRNFGQLAAPTHAAAGHNPLCGDRLALQLRVDGGRIVEVAFEGRGCAIDVAAASLMTEAVKGKLVTEADALFHRFHELVLGEPSPEAGGPDLGKLVAFGGVRKYPVRVKCATLPWHTLRAALSGAASPATAVSTES